VSISSKSLNWLPRHAANLFARRELRNLHTRILNPTTDLLEQ
jgi:O-acetylhomoserine/O-acetylserine sulfhydrylase-like pyridoxal-dependent enzyme